MELLVVLLVVPRVMVDDLLPDDSGHYHSLHMLSRGSGLKLFEGYLNFGFAYFWDCFHSADFVDEGWLLQYLVLGTEEHCSCYLFCQPCVPLSLILKKKKHVPNIEYREFELWREDRSATQMRSRLGNV